MAKLPRAQLVDPSVAGHIEFGGGINVTGVVTATGFEGNTTGTATNLTGSPNVVGAIVTATTYKGSGAGITGLAGTSYIGQTTSFTSAATYTIDLSKGNVVHIEDGGFNGTATVGFSNTSTGSGEVRIVRKPICARCNCEIYLNWPSNITWAGDGQKPDSIFNPRCNNVQEITLLTTDSGASWYGSETVRSDPSTTNVWMWGWQHRHGWFGTGTYYGTCCDCEKYSSPVSIGASWMSGCNPYSEFKDIQFGYYYALGLKRDGTLWSWGQNNQGVLGTNQDTSCSWSSPVQIGIDNDWQSLGNTNAGVAEVAGAIKNDGTMWTWGNGGSGKLGNNKECSYSVPIQICHCIGYKWKCLSFSNDGALAIDCTGILWGWGRNYQAQRSAGQLGTSINNKSAPAKVCASSFCWKAITMMQSGSMGVKSDGTLWAWGCGHNGQLGLSDWSSGGAGFPCSPRQVGSATDWKCVWGGEYNGAGLRGNQLYTWGIAYCGVLGHNSQSDFGGMRSSPVSAVGSFHCNLRCVHFASYGVSALDCCGRLWMWGSNVDGKFGVPNCPLNKNHSSPVQIMCDRKFGSISGSFCHQTAISVTC